MLMVLEGEGRKQVYFPAYITSKLLREAYSILWKGLPSGRPFFIRTVSIYNQAKRGGS